MHCNMSAVQKVSNVWGEHHQSWTILTYRVIWIFPFLDLPANQRLQLENIMKKVMGVAYMPEDVTGNRLIHLHFTSLVSA